MTIAVATSYGGSDRGGVLETVAISPILLVAWQAHTFVSDTSHVFTSLEHYLPAVNGLLFNKSDKHNSRCDLAEELKEGFE